MGRLGVYYQAYKSIEIPEWLWKIIDRPTADYWIKWNVLYYKENDDDKTYKQYEIDVDGAEVDYKRPDNIEKIEDD